MDDKIGLEIEIHHVPKEGTFAVLYMHDESSGSIAGTLPAPWPGSDIKANIFIGVATQTELGRQKIKDAMDVGSSDT